MVTKRGGIMGNHAGCLVSGFDVFEIAMMVRVGYLYQGQFGIWVDYELMFSLDFSVFLAN